MKLPKGCGLLVGLGIAILIGGYLWLTQLWLPFMEPEIQQVLEEQFPGPGTRLRGFYQQTENCRIALTDSDSLGIRYVKVVRENGQWVYVDHTYRAGGLPPMIECP